MEQVQAVSPRRFPTLALLFLLVAGPFIGLVLLKWPSAIHAVLKVMASGNWASHSDLIPSAGLSIWLRPWARMVSYLFTIRWALLWGILISSAIRAFLNLGVLKSRYSAGIAGIPLMLCSCCVAPVASGAFRRTGKLGPTLALLLAAPSLNPAALALTFLLFPLRVGIARLLMAAFMVFVGSGIVVAFTGERCESTEGTGPESKRMSSPRDALSAFAKALQKTTFETLPYILLGVLVSMIVAEVAPLQKWVVLSPVLAVIVVAACAVPMALPTFFEIPLALGMMAAHLPLGAVAAFVFAGPAVNLPSLFTLGGAAGKRVAIALAVAVFVVACVGGVVVG